MTHARIFTVSFRIAIFFLALAAMPAAAAGPDGEAAAAGARIPGRDALRAAIAAVDAMTTGISLLTSARGRYFYLRRDPGTQVARLVMRDPRGVETVLVDPASLGGTTPATIERFAPSRDGSLVAYVVSPAGAGPGTLRVVETATGATRPDLIDGTRISSVSWGPDGSFFYTRRGDPLVHRHGLGTDARRDRVVADFARLAPVSGAAVPPVMVALTPGSDFALVRIGDLVSPDASFYAAPVAALDHAGAAPLAWTLVAGPMDAVLDIAVRGARIDLLTTRDAPHGKVVETDLAHPAIAAAPVVVSSGSGVLTGIARAADGLYVARRDGAVTTLLRLADGAARPEIVTLPFIGTIAPRAEKGGEEDGGGLITDPSEPGATIGLQDWLQPLAWMHYDPAAHGVTELGLAPPFPRGLRPYQAVETTAPMPDGRLAALSIVSRRDLARDRHPPVLLESGDPAFVATMLPWLDGGGILAVAHGQGGGIDAFIACARSLVARHITDPAHLSAVGGKIVAGAVTREPGLFRAVVIRGAGVTDMPPPMQGKAASPATLLVPGAAGTSRARDDADAQAFLLWQLGEPGYQPPQ